MNKVVKSPRIAALLVSTVLFCVVLGLEILAIHEYFTTFVAGEEVIGAYALHAGTAALYVLALLVINRRYLVAHGAAARMLVYVTVGAMCGFAFLCSLVAYIFLTRW